MVPVQFFQVAATAIPTLMIALFIGAKNGENVAKRMSASGWFIKALGVLGTLAFLTAILFGELASLIGVIANGGGTTRADLIMWVIILMLLVLSFELVDPVARVLGGKRWIVYLALLILFGVSTNFADNSIHMFKLSHPAQ